jgi:hypothetical protein
MDQNKKERTTQEWNLKPRFDYADGTHSMAVWGSELIIELEWYYTEHDRDSNHDKIDIRRQAVREKIYFDGNNYKIISKCPDNEKCKHWIFYYGAETLTKTMNEEELKKYLSHSLNSFDHLTHKYNRPLIKGHDIVYNLWRLRRLPLSMNYVFYGIIESSNLPKDIKKKILYSNISRDDYDYTATTINDLITMYNNLNDDKIELINIE